MQPISVPEPPAGSALVAALGARAPSVGTPADQIVPSPKRLRLSAEVLWSRLQQLMQWRQDGLLTEQEFRQQKWP